MAKRQLNLLKDQLKAANEYDESDTNLDDTVKTAAIEKRNQIIKAGSWKKLAMLIDNHVFNRTNGEYKIQRKRIASICDLAVLCWDKVYPEELEFITKNNLLEKYNQMIVDSNANNLWTAIVIDLCWWINCVVRKIPKLKFKSERRHRPTPTAKRRSINLLLINYEKFKNIMNKVERPDYTTPKVSKVSKIFVATTSGSMVPFMWNNTLAENEDPNDKLYTLITKNLEQVNNINKKLTMKTQKCILKPDGSIEQSSIKGTKYLINDISDAVNILNDATTFKSLILKFIPIDPDKENVRALTLPMKVSLAIQPPKGLTVKETWYYDPGKPPKQQRGNEKIENIIKEYLNKGAENEYNISIGDEAHNINDWSDIEEILNNIAKRRPDKEYYVHINPVCNLTIILPEGNQKTMKTQWNKDLTNKFSFINNEDVTAATAKYRAQPTEYLWQFRGKKYPLETLSYINVSDYKPNETITILKREFIRVDLEISDSNKQTQTFALLYDPSSQATDLTDKFQGDGFEKLKKLINEYKEVTTAAFLDGGSEIPLSYTLAELLETAQLVPENNNSIIKKLGFNFPFSGAAPEPAPAKIQVNVMSLIGIIPRYWTINITQASKISDIIKEASNKFNLDKLELECCVGDCEREEYAIVSPSDLAIKHLNTPGYDTNLFFIRPATTLTFESYSTEDEFNRTVSSLQSQQPRPVNQPSQPAPAPAQGETPITFEVKDEIIAYNFPDTATVQTAKEKLAQRYSVKPEDVTLFFANKALKETFLLKRLRIKDNKIAVTITDYNPVLLFSVKGR
ncbi:MAG: hypothetical protein NkDv07_0124 [Candidatus Improbicoccus devescovinae]|nr:MAG: hypothetical protein NkDv07_0124 [Candidatus Improbicoccus devescovinae]